MSHGDSFPSKAALTPRSFMAISAYNGHLANVGRVCTDATWHHFININIDGTDTVRNGMQDGMGNDTPDMQKIREYYKNLASWLMPKRRRFCFRFPWIITEVLRYPLFEELRVPDLSAATPPQLREIGQKVSTALTDNFPRWQAQSLVADALEDALGEKSAADLLGQSRNYGRLSGSEIALAALGGVVIATIDTAIALRDKAEVDVEEVFTPIAKAAAKIAVQKFQEHSLKELHTIQALLANIFGSPEVRKSGAKKKEPTEAI